jgi:hypothetical protein
VPPKQKNSYRVRRLQAVVDRDFSELPPELREDYYLFFAPLLGSDPRSLLGKASNHRLRGALQGFRAIDRIGDDESYRLVYRILDKSAPRTVWIYSFAEHDLAYERAQLRRKRR